ncbi:MAG: hypothetical protein WCV88_05605 [Patescibacteria group bacterium]
MDKTGEPTRLRYPEEIKFRNYELELSQRLEKLLETNLSVTVIAEILDAKEFLQQDGKGRSSAYQRFDAKQYIRHAVDRAKVAGIFLELPQGALSIEDIILPPDVGEMQQGEGEGSVEEGRDVPRTKYLIEVLSVLQAPYSIIDGQTDSRMMREQSYKIFLIPDHQKIIFVNNEFGNATFVVHQLAGPGDWRTFSMLTKDELKLQAETGLVTPVIWTTEPEWKERMRILIMQEGSLPPATPIESVEQSVAKRTVELPPDGWVTNLQLAREQRKDFDTIKKIIMRYRATYPEWFGQYKKKMGPPAEYISPELADIIRTELQIIEAAPDGWLIPRGLGKLLGKDVSSVTSRAEKHRTTHPEWFRVYQPRHGRATEYIAPELIALISEELIDNELAPPGWLTNSGIAEELGREFNMVKKAADLFRAAHPKWFHFYTDKIGHLREHYAPELVVEIQNTFTALEYAPAGWMTKTTASDSTGLSTKLVEKIVNEQRAAHPEWFHTYQPQRGPVTEHLSPELVSLLAQEAQQYPAPLDGWATVGGLARRFNVADRTIARRVGFYRTEHPEWFRYFRTGGGVFEFIDPELVETIGQNFLKR